MYIIYSAMMSIIERTPPVGTLNVDAYQLTYLLLKGYLQGLKQEVVQCAASGFL